MKPVLDHGDFVPGGVAVERLRTLFDELGFADAGIRARVTGDLALKAEEFASVERQARVAGLVSFLLVSTLLWLALGSWRLILASIATLVLGFGWTIGFAALAVGHMNLISVTFIVLFIGLGIDFCIHFSMRYQELRGRGVAHAGALSETTRGVGGSLMLCAVTTAIGFSAFVPTAYLGVAELGLISGVGMLLALLASLTVLPAALSLGDVAAPLPKAPARRLGLPRWPLRAPRAVVAVGIVLGATGAATLPHLVVDANPLRVRDPGTESVSTFEELIRDESVNPWSIDVLLGDAAAAERLAQELNALPSVREARTLAGYVPGRQPEKLALVEDLALVLGEPGPVLPPPDVAENLAAMGRVRERLAALEAEGTGRLAAVAARLGPELDRFLADSGGDARALEALRVGMVEAIVDRIERLDRALQAGPVTASDLPAELRERMVSADGRALVEVLPREDLNDDDALERFVSDVRALAPEATGASVYMLEASRAIVDALLQALATALVLVSAVLLLLWRNLREPAAVLAPLALAVLATVGLSVASGLAINFADVIVIPLILGIGVDSGIHLVHRHRDRAREPDASVGDLLATSTPRAILWSAASTVGSFLSLAFATHLGMASLGQLLTVGVAMTVVANLIFLPALLAWMDRGRSR